MPSDDIQLCCAAVAGNQGSHKCTRGGRWARRARKGPLGPAVTLHIGSYTSYRPLTSHRPLRVIPVIYTWYRLLSTPAVT